MKRIIHRIAAGVATVCIATFFVVTVLVEGFGSNASIALVKSWIVMPGLFILIPAIALAGASGFALAGSRKGRLLERKARRMKVIAANGLLILLPAAIVLDLWASANVYDSRFYAVQGLELLAGAVNLSLMSLNIRDGLKMTGRRGRPLPDN